MTRYDPHPQAHDDARTTPHGFTGADLSDFQAPEAPVGEVAAEGVPEPLTVFGPADAEAPEPSADVVERAGDLIDHHRRLRTSHGLAQDLAAAGLLADPAETERRENVAKAWAERWLGERDRARDLAAALEADNARLTEALREFVDSRGVNVGESDSEWYRGYRQAQRECLLDARKIDAALSDEATR